MKQSRDLYLEAAMMPDYIESKEMAREAVKTVVGVFVSKLPEEDAYYFTDHLPEYLTYKNLRGHQENISPTSPDDCVTLLQDKLKISEERAEELMLKIISVVETETKDKDRNITDHLSAEWRNLFQHVGQ